MRPWLAGNVLAGKVLAGKVLAGKVLAGKVLAGKVLGAKARLNEVPGSRHGLRSETLHCNPNRTMLRI